MKYYQLGLSVIGSLLCASTLSAEYLYGGYLVPSFSTQYSAWDVFYTPSGNPNYPDFAAPYGSKGLVPSPPPNSAPTNPSAFADIRNPTIQNDNASGAFIIGAGTDGNIYSAGGPLQLSLNDPGTAYTAGSPLRTVVFQFQTAGTLADFSSIKLQYTDGSGTHQVPYSEIIREYRGSGSSFGGLANRSAIQWKLAGTITSYKILMNASGSSMSLQQVSLDTAGAYGLVVPSSGKWTGTTGNWSTTSNWAVNANNGNLLPESNANAVFGNASAATVTLDSSRTIGEMIFDTANNVTINGTSTLTSNTGITTTSAVGSGNQFAINTPYHFGALNVFDIQNGTLSMNNVMSGSYGFLKTGGGTLLLPSSNTFTGSVTVDGGILRISGVNTYTGATNVLFGTLELGSNAVSGSGALGNATSAITIGANSDTFANVGDTSARLSLDGDRIVGRAITFERGIFNKYITAKNTTSGATISGAVDLGTLVFADNVHFQAQSASDRLIFSGAVIGGTAANKVYADGTGTVVFSGAVKTYANSTEVTSGALELASGSGYTGSGNITVAAGANLKVNGTLGGSGSLTINGCLSGSGNVNRVFTLTSGGKISPGNSVNQIDTVGETWGSGGIYDWEIKDGDATPGTGWDTISITGTLSISALAGDEFTIDLASLGLSDMPGLATDFDQILPYSWLIASASGGITGYESTKFVLDTADFQNSFSGVFGIDQTGNNLFLTYSPIPEPSTAAIFIAGVLSMGLLRRNRSTSI